MLRNYDVANIDEYIAIAPAESRPKLGELRDVIRAAVPMAEEVIAWGMPCFKQLGYVAGFMPMSGYVSFGFIDQISPEVRKTLEASGYKTGSKTMRIKFDQPVPAASIKQILSDTIAKNHAKQAEKAK